MQKVEVEADVRSLYGVTPQKINGKLSKVRNRLRIARSLQLSLANWLGDIQW
jgi:ribosomal protein L23